MKVVTEVKLELQKSLLLNAEEPLGGAQLMVLPKHFKPSNNNSASYIISFI